ncbi:MAG: NAD(P)H-dependent oxidoreductase [Cyanobacteria bacterium REEB67]|nr:NAD(P)H-dependent oxidoreductase [Cyanobacteria bacterium REEB67]
MASKFLIISASLNLNSKSRVLMQELLTLLPADVEREFIDLQDYDLPMCDGGPCYTDPIVLKLQRSVANADCILVGIPVYNFACSASFKNLVELTGRAWEEKIVGFVCAAGGHSSYMSVMNVANSLMLDFRCVIIPRFVYSEGSSFAEGKLKDAKIKERLAELKDTAVKMTSALAKKAALLPE